jgi:hypothetical protein
MGDRKQPTPCPTNQMKPDPPPAPPRKRAGASTEPFEGIEPYYQRLFRQIKQRNRDTAQGTGGDIACLVAMIEWLWERKP